MTTPNRGSLAPAQRDVFPSLECPITHPTLLRAGMPDLVDQLGHLVGLEARAVQAVLVAVIAERRARA
jgi:hypothetical protein